MKLFKNTKGDLQISEHELDAMTRQLDEMHQETFPGVRRTMDEFAANVAHEQGQNPDLRIPGFGRRGFLAGVGGVALLGTLAACSSDGGSGGGSGSPSEAPTSSAMGSGSSSSAGGSKYTGDLKVVALAAALENLAVGAYTLAIQAAGAGKLGAVPKSVATFAATAMSQHKDHAAAWNGVLGKANLPKITGTPVTIAADQVKQLKAATSVADVAKLALGLEEAAAQTYLFAASNVTDTGGIMTAATIEPVEQMHAAILNFVLGQYPVPVSFLGTDKAASTDMLTV
ncbi:ferritin family protein [Jatrophihabitans fulvus]